MPFIPSASAAIQKTGRLTAYSVMLCCSLALAALPASEAVAQTNTGENHSDPAGVWFNFTSCPSQRYSVTIADLAKTGESQYTGSVTARRVTANGAVIDWETGGIEENGTVVISVRDSNSPAEIAFTGISDWNSGQGVTLKGEFASDFDTFVISSTDGQCHWENPVRTEQHAALKFNPHAMSPATRKRLEALQGDWDNDPDRDATAGQLLEASAEAESYFANLAGNADADAQQGDSRIARYIHDALEHRGQLEQAERWRDYWLIASAKEGGITGDFAAVQWFFVLLADATVRSPEVFEQVLDILNAGPNWFSGSSDSPALGYLESGVEVTARGNMAQTGYLLGRSAKKYAEKYAGDRRDIVFQQGLQMAVFNWRQGGASAVATELASLRATLPEVGPQLTPNQLAAYHALEASVAVSLLEFSRARGQFEHAVAYLKRANSSGNVTDSAVTAVELLWQLASETLRRDDCDQCIATLLSPIADLITTLSTQQDLASHRGYAYLLMQMAPEDALTREQRRLVDRSVFQPSASRQLRAARHSSVSAALSGLIVTGSDQTRAIMELVTASTLSGARTQVDRTLGSYIEFAGEFGDYLGTLCVAVDFATALGDNGYAIAEQAALERVARFWFYGYGDEKRNYDDAMSANMATLVAPGLVRLAELRTGSEPLTAFSDELREATTMVTQKLNREWRVGGPDAVGSLRVLRPTIRKLARLLITAEPSDKAVAADMHRQGFRMMQIAALSDTAAALQVTLLQREMDRLGVSGLVQRQQSLLFEIDLLEAAARQQEWLIVPTGITRAIGIKRSEMAAIEGKLREAGFDPDTSAFSGASLPSQDEFAKELDAGEVLVLIQTEDDVSVIVTVDSQAVLRSHVSDLGRASLEAAVINIRSGIDLGRGEFPDFPVGDAYKLYQRLFGSLGPVVADSDRIISLVSGPLQAMPLGILVTKPPEMETLTLDTIGSARISWLALSTAETRTPGLGTFASPAQGPDKAVAEFNFLGIGDPILNSSGVSRSGISLDELPARDRVADVELLRSLPSLPETQDELKELGQHFDRGHGDLLVRRDASESTIKERDLAGFDIIAFATHGVLAGQIFQDSEPGLVLTPPETGSTDDDGFLSMSEISKLSLNAQLVILSACDTATSDGRPLADGLSGLARAFFTAGAHNVLATHWEIPSIPSVALTTGMVRAYANQRTGRDDLDKWSKTLREAQEAMIAGKSGEPEFAHPASWGAFQLVGAMSR